MSKIKPVSDYLLIKQIKTEAKTASGLLVAEQGKERLCAGEVLSVGDLVDRFKVGDNVIYKPFTTYEFSDRNQDEVLVHQEDVIAIMEAE